MIVGGIVAIVIIAFVPLLFALTFRGSPSLARKKKQSLNFQGLAETLNLVYSPKNPSPGSLKGKYRGFDVSVEPGNESMIKLHLFETSIIILSSSRRRYKKHLGTRRFDFIDSDLNAFFRTRFANESNIEKLSDQRALADYVRALTKRWKNSILDLTFSAGELSIRMNYGMKKDAEHGKIRVSLVPLKVKNEGLVYKSECYYIPTAEIQPILDELVGLATIIKAT